MGILTMMLLFILALFGLVSSGMLMKKYNDAKDTTSTGYKYTIFSLIFFILAVIGTLVIGGMSLSKGSTGAATNGRANGNRTNASALAPGVKPIGTVTAQLV